MKCPDHLIHTLKAILTNNIFHKGWSKIKERTSLGLSGTYFSQMKVCTKLDYLSEFKVIIEYIPFTTGYSPRNWKISINVIIQKKGKGDWVQDLYIINLIKVGFNFNNKVIAKIIMEYAEQKKLPTKRIIQKLQRAQSNLSSD